MTEAETMTRKKKEDIKEKREKSYSISIALSKVSGIGGYVKLAAWFFTNVVQSVQVTHFIG